jgi:hypothetical protein
MLFLTRVEYCDVFFTPHEDFKEGNILGDMSRGETKLPLHK